MNRAVFLDRDGVLNLDVGYTFRVTDLRIPEDVPAALGELKALGFKLIVITNQSGVARGRFTLADVAEFNSALQAELIRAGGPQLDLIKVCPHHPAGKVALYTHHCECRKPGTKLVDEACIELDIDRQASFFIGDKWSDVMCAVGAGVRPFLVQSQEGLSYDLPAHVSSVSESDSDDGVKVVSADESGPVEVHSSLSSAVSSLLTFCS